MYRIKSYKHSTVYIDYVSGFLYESIIFVYKTA